MTQSDLVKVTGLSKPRISQYVNGTYEAKQQALCVLADALNVNISWLMGNDVPMERVEDIDEKNYSKTFQILFNQLKNDEDKLYIIEQIIRLKEEENKKNEFDKKNLDD